MSFYINIYLINCTTMSSIIFYNLTWNCDTIIFVAFTRISNFERSPSVYLWNKMFCVIVNGKLWKFWKEMIEAGNTKPRMRYGRWNYVVVKSHVLLFFRLPLFCLSHTLIRHDCAKGSSAILRILNCIALFLSVPLSLPLFLFLFLFLPQSTNNCRI